MSFNELNSKELTDALRRLNPEIAAQPERVEGVLLNNSR